MYPLLAHCITLLVRHIRVSGSLAGLGFFVCRCMLFLLVSFVIAAAQIKSWIMTYCICSWACRVRISFFVGADFEVDRQTTTVDAADGCRGHPGCGRGTTMYSQRWLDQRRIRVSPTAISLSPPNRSGVTFKPRAQTQIRPLRWHGGRIKRQGG